VRATIKDLSGTMPEALPAPDVSIKQTENTKLKFPSFETKPITLPMRDRDLMQGLHNL
jgi:hypothetical protein